MVKHHVEKIEDDTLRGAIEAIIFVSPEPLSLSRMAEILRQDKDTIQCILQGLIEEYNSNNRGIYIGEVAGGYRMETNPVYSSYILQLYKRRSYERLSKPALETLSIIVYRQPVTKGDIELIRGVSVDSVIHTLIEKQLIRECGHREVPGRPTLYSTTKRFLEYFGLKSIKDLPQITTSNKDGNNEKET